MHWRRPGLTAPLPHKLYISPEPEFVPIIFPILVDTFGAMEVPSFKIGISSGALFRPDKLIAYFSNRDHLSIVAEELNASLNRIPAHGVPFTAPLDQSGLLSWGYDPGMGVGSWRQLIAQTVGNAVALAPFTTIDQTVYNTKKALKRAGVDPDTWEPIPEAFLQ